MNETLPVKLTSWNILNPAYAHRHYYGEKSMPHLEWDKRRPLMMKFLSVLQSDVYCLQESTEAIAADVKRSLPDHDISWTRRKKGSDDGCATLWRSSRFDKVYENVIHHPNGTHVILAILLRERETRAMFWCCNTHVNYETREDDLVKMLFMMNTDLRFARLPIVVVGDFNAERNESWYQSLQPNGFRDTWDGRDMKANQFTFSNGGVIPNKWVDYILVRGNIEPVEVQLGLWDPECHDLPSSTVPSDHLPLTLWFTGFRTIDVLGRSINVTEQDPFCVNSTGQ